MDTLLEPVSLFDMETPLGQPFLDGYSGFDRPFSAEFDDQGLNPFWQDPFLVDAAAFFFPPKMTWETATEVHLRVQGQRYRFACVDCVLYSLETRHKKEKITGYGSVIMQPVSRSGDLTLIRSQEWKKHFTPQALSAARAYLINQIIFEGGMYSAWGRKMAVMLETSLFDLLPTMKEVDKSEADIIWLIHSLTINPVCERHTVTQHRQVYTKYPQSWNKMMGPWMKKEKHFFKEIKQQYLRLVDRD